MRTVVRHLATVAIHTSNDDSYVSSNQVSAQEQIKNFNPTLSENSAEIINKEKNSWG